MAFLKKKEIKVEHFPVMIKFWNFTSSTLLYFCSELLQL